jgi:hypothetical protein
MGWTQGEKLRFYVFIESKTEVTGVEVTKGQVDIERHGTSARNVNGWIERTPPGPVFIKLTGEMGEVKTVSHMPDEASPKEVLKKLTGEVKNDESKSIKRT